MTTLLAFLLVAALWALLLGALNHHDGRSRFSGRTRPPRSHVPDVFEPSARF